MESVGGNYGEVLDDVGELSSSPDDKSGVQASPPTEEDEAERGEVQSRTRRRSFRRVSADGDGIELAGYRSR